MMYDVAMTRTQLLLEPWQLEALRSAANSEGDSISGLVRRILSRYFSAPSGPAGARAPRLEDAVGIFDDPGFSGSDHDAALYGAAGEADFAVAAGKPAPTSGGSAKADRAGVARKRRRTRG